MTYNILSLDGGGAWALIEVRTLIQMFGQDATGHEVLGNFDMVAANSGGSLVLAGLMENMTLGTVLTLFMDQKNRSAIFSPSTSLADRSLSWLSGIGPKYSAANKLPALERLLPQTGNTLLGQVASGIKGRSGLPIHVLIISFDYDRNRAAFFRSVAADKGFGYGTAASVTLAAAVHASTNAPVNYFDAPAQIPRQTDRFWDGGITGNNNPALAACVEAATLGHAPTDLRVLSLGTGTVCLPLADPGAAASAYYASRGDSSLLGDLTKLATSILDDPPDFASFAVHMMCGAGTGLPAGVPSRLVRMNPMVSPTMTNGAWACPAGWTAAQFQYICNLGMDAVQDNDVQYIDDWCTLWMLDNAPNQPIRMNGDTLQPEIGAGTYSEAMAAWTALSGIVPVETNVAAVA